MSGVQEVRLQDEERGSRWSARRKEEMVLRLLRGESLDRLARESGQAAGTISAWREAFLAAGQEGLKTRPRRSRTSRCVRRSARSASRRWRIDILRGLIEEMGRTPRSPRRSQ